MYMFYISAVYQLHSNYVAATVSYYRQMILAGCVAFARYVGATRVETELLPQCWEQVNDIGYMIL